MCIYFYYCLLLLLNVGLPWILPWLREQNALLLVVVGGQGSKNKIKQTISVTKSPSVACDMNIEHKIFRLIHLVVLGEYKL